MESVRGWGDTAPGVLQEVIVEYDKNEIERDCFQFICGVCWRFMADAESLVHKAYFNLPLTSMSLCILSNFGYPDELRCSLVA